MKRILRFFGLISFADLSLAARRYDDMQTNIYNRYLEESITYIDAKKAQTAMEEGWKGVGALEFVSQLILEKNE